MIWVKSVLVGIAAAILTAIVTTVALPVLTLTMAMWWADIGEGSGGIGAFSSGTELVLLPAIAFALGFWWNVRRERRNRGPSAV